jgi:hypothetical protein
VITSPKGIFGGLWRFWIVIIRPDFALETLGEDITMTFVIFYLEF